MDKLTSLVQSEAQQWYFVILIVPLTFETTVRAQYAVKQQQREKCASGAMEAI